MTLSTLDIVIILGYLAAVIFLGFYLRKLASKDITAYFLGGRKVPWYVLGVSNASSMFDITGTMWFVTVLFIYGLKGAWLPWLWPTFNQIFLMIYLAIWIRRSGVITGAEWINTRFGNDKGAELSRLSVVIFAIISVIGFLCYDFQGIGRFASIILPWNFSPNTYALIIMGITTFYVVMGGMLSVVVTDVLQFVMLTIASVVIGVIAINSISPADIAAAVPGGWNELFFGWKLNIDWSNLIPGINNKIASDGYSLFAIVWMMILFKGILISLAGPAPNYDMQRVLATRKPKESAYMSGMVSIALFPRWLMIGGLVAIGLVFLSPQLKAMGPNIDFEQIMPMVIKNYLPVGMIGLVIAGLLATYMSTFDSTVNAGAAYLVNDVYKRYIRPDASQKQHVLMGYFASILIVVVGIIFGLMAKSIHSVMQWIVSGLYVGYTAPNVLKWHWWRFNGYGYFWGMITGVAASLIIPAIFPNLQIIYAFPVIFVISLAASIIGSLLTKAQDRETLKSFYRNVRPWGFWKPVHEMVLRDNPKFENKSSCKRDLFNVAIGIIWQFTLVMIPLYLVFQDFKSLSISAGICLVTSFILKKNWFDKLENE